MKTLALATATLGLAFTAAPAFADTGELRTTSVSLAGIDLETAEGQAMLDRRIEGAARQVCGYHDKRPGTRLRRGEVRECLVAARASARQQVASIIDDQQRGG